jgi:hypothetical protein
MTIPATTAIALPFTHTIGVDFAFNAGDPVSGGLDSGVYRMWLAPAASCFVRACAAKMTALAAAEL